MTVENATFALFGGLLIGVSATLLLLLNGRIAGICGIIAAAVLPAQTERAWRWLFLAGLGVGTVLWHALSGAPVPAETGASPALIIAAGVLVGFGTEMANGCTSGHGVCGLGRLSPRSLVATISFMLAGAVMVLLVRHVIGG